MILARSSYLLRVIETRGVLIHDSIYLCIHLEIHIRSLHDDVLVDQSDLVVSQPFRLFE